MTKGGGDRTVAGGALTPADKLKVEALRQRVKGDLPTRYDTDFNLLRWLVSADRVAKAADAFELAERNLRNHLRYRKTLRLDERPAPGWQDNPLFRDRLLPHNHLVQGDRHNRLLWCIEYKTLNLEALIHTMKSSDLLQYHFWQYEEMLVHVMEHEARTRQFSGIHHVIDLKGYPMNPFTMLFVNNGNMAYYGHLLHWEHYPELCGPNQIVNAARWMTIPYRLVRSVMPHGFAERFRLHDANYHDALAADIDPAALPASLGGRRADVATTPALPLEHCAARHEPPAAGTDHVHLVVSPRRRKMVPVRVPTDGARLHWHFLTDADVYFGVFREPPDAPPPPPHADGQTAPPPDIDRLEMVFPWLKLAAKLVAESGEIERAPAGNYYLVFCNKSSRFQRRNVHLKVDTGDGQCRSRNERTLSL